MTYPISPWRWHLKKFARRGTVLGGMTAGRLGLRTRPARLTVLTYHRFDGQRYDPVAINRDDFEDQLRWLSTEVHVLDAAGFISLVDSGRAPERDMVLLTVDDGHRSFYQSAFPLLQRYRLPAIVFVCPGLIGSNSSEFMNWDHLAELQDHGLEIAPHGHTHRSLTRIGLAEAEIEITRAKTALKQRLGVDTPFFSLPFGTRRDVSRPLADLLLAQGYRFCFTSIHGRGRLLSTPNLFPRAKVEGGESLAMFRGIALGGLDLWRVVDQLAWPLQQRGRF